MIVGGRGCRAALHFGVRAGESQDKVPTLYWLPKLHEGPYRAGFVAGSGSCAAAELSGLLASCLAAVGGHVIKCCEKVYERSGGDLFWSIKNSGEILGKLGAGGFNETSLSACGFSALCTALPHGLVKDKLVGLIGGGLPEGGLSLPCV